MSFQKRWIEGKTIKSVVVHTGCEDNLCGTGTALQSIVFTDGSRVDLEVQDSEDFPWVRPIYRKAPKKGG